MRSLVGVSKRLELRETMFKILITAMMIFTLMLCFSNKAFATGETGNTGEVQTTSRVNNEDELKTYIGNHVEYVGGTVSNKGLPTSVWSKLYLTYGSETAPDGYKQATTISRNGDTAIVWYPEAQAEKMIKNINNQNNYNAAQQKVNNIETELGLQADTSGASEALSGVTPMISLIAGFIVILLTAFMLVFTAIDCVYIAFPAFRNKCEEAKASGNKMMTKTGKDGESQLRWVTDDAQYAIETGTIDSGKNKWLIYLKRRIISYVALGIVIFMFFTGNITLLIEIAIKMVSGLMNVLSGFGA